MSKQYKLTTLQDVFEQVPVDKIHLCLRELGDAMVEAKRLSEVVKETAWRAAFKWASPCTWIDDGKENQTFRFLDGESGEELMQAKRTQK